MSGSRQAIVIVFGASLLVPAAARAGCTVTRDDADGNGSQDLVITGDALKQILYVFTVPSGSCINLDCNGNGFFGDPGDVVSCPQVTAFESITIDLKGKDSIWVGSYGAFANQTHQYKVLLGPGGNTVTLGDGAPFASTAFVASGGSSFVYDIVGGSGTDDVKIDFGKEVNSIADTALIFRGDLGAGNDTLTVTSPTTGLLRSDWEVDVALGLGNNTATVSHNHGDTPGAAREYSRYDIEGGDSTVNSDTVVLDVAGLDGSDHSARLLANANLRAGNDTFVANVDADTFYTYGYARVRANGGSGNDTLTIADSGQYYGGMDGVMDFGIKGGPGNDTLTLDWFNSYSFATTGTYRARLDGGDGNDNVLLSLVNDPHNWVPGGYAPANIDLYASGGRGSDAMLFVPLDLYGTATFDPIGLGLVTGGLDPNDVCVASPSAEQLSCELN